MKKLTGNTLIYVNLALVAVVGIMVYLYFRTRSTVTTSTATGSGSLSLPVNSIAPGELYPDTPTKGNTTTNYDALPPISGKDLILNKGDTFQDALRSYLGLG